MPRGDGLEKEEKKDAKSSTPSKRPVARKRSSGEKSKLAPQARAVARKRASKPVDSSKSSSDDSNQGSVVPRTSRLKQRYRDEVRPALVREFGYRSIMEAPELEKIVLNMGLGEAMENARALEATSDHFATITGQHPVVTKARRSVAAFKVRKGMSIGIMVTLRGTRMYDFFDRLVNAAMPRIRDFRGTSRHSFDGRGNYSLAIREQAIFAEIDYNQVDRVRSFEVTMVTTARTDQEGLRLLELMGMPFTREQNGR